jgi:hypothetical protein
MGFWSTIDEALFGGPGEVGGLIGTPTNYLMDKVSDAADATLETANEAIYYAQENPKTAAAIALGTLATGGVVASMAGTAAIAAAPKIASFVGATGVLGSASSGTAISSLSGAALAKASLASIGGGAVAAGGGGIAAGTAAIGTTASIAAGTATTATVGATVRKTVK